MAPNDHRRGRGAGAEQARGEPRGTLCQSDYADSESVEKTFLEYSPAEL